MERKANFYNQKTTLQRYCFYMKDNGVDLLTSEAMALVSAIAEQRCVKLSPQHLNQVFLRGEAYYPSKTWTKIKREVEGLPVTGLRFERIISEDAEARDCLYIQTEKEEFLILQPLRDMSLKTVMELRALKKCKKKFADFTEYFDTISAEIPEISV